MKETKDTLCRENKENAHHSNKLNNRNNNSSCSSGSIIGSIAGSCSTYNSSSSCSDTESSVSFCSILCKSDQSFARKVSNRFNFSNSKFKHEGQQKFAVQILTNDKSIDRMHNINHFSLHCKTIKNGCRWNCTADNILKRNAPIYENYGDSRECTDFFLSQTTNMLGNTNKHICPCGKSNDSGNMHNNNECVRRTVACTLRKNSDMKGIVLPNIKKEYYMKMTKFGNNSHQNLKVKYADDYFSCNSTGSNKYSENCTVANQEVQCNCNDNSKCRIYEFNGKVMNDSLHIIEDLQKDEPGKKESDSSKYNNNNNKNDIGYERLNSLSVINDATCKHFNVNTGKLFLSNVYDNDLNFPCCDMNKTSENSSFYLKNTFNKSFPVNNIDNMSRSNYLENCRCCSIDCQVLQSGKTTIPYATNIYHCCSSRKSSEIIEEYLIRFQNNINKLLLSGNGDVFSFFRLEEKKSLNARSYKRSNIEKCIKNVDDKLSNVQSSNNIDNPESNGSSRNMNYVKINDLPSTYNEDLSDVTLTDTENNQWDHVHDWKDYSEYGISPRISAQNTHSSMLNTSSLQVNLRKQLHNFFSLTRRAQQFLHLGLNDIPMKEPLMKPDDVKLSRISKIDNDSILCFTLNINSNDFL